MASSKIKFKIKLGESEKEIAVNIGLDSEIKKEWEKQLTSSTQLLV